MKTIKQLLATILMFSILPTVALATDTKVSDILGDQEIDEELISELNQTEEERESDFENQLLLSIPEQTDNPSHILTFTDPSEEEDGVQLEIDGGEYKEIDSPYTLPALSIGNHILKFKFTDNEGATQVLEETLIVLPRAPIVRTPQIEEGVITISGTGLANAELILLTTHGTSSDIQTLDIDSDGNWTTTYTPEENSKYIFNISAYTRKNGYASNVSEIVTFSTEAKVSNTGDQNNAVVFSISSLTDPVGIFNDSPDFVIFTAVVLALGALISLMFTTLFKKGHEEKKIKDLEKKIKNNEKENKGLTLRERLAQEQKEDAKKKDSKKDTKKKEEKKSKNNEEKKEKVFTKENFMKDFKNFDPDKKNGKEKKIKVSLTSKEE